MIAFSWNLPGGVLPYTYTTDDPAQLPAILAAGAGAGVVSWNKTNWLLTTYVGSAPVITSQPQSVTLAPSNSVTFTVIASGSGNLLYQWYRNTNSLIASATNSTFTLNNVQATNAETYSVIVTNTAGSVTSSFAVLTVSSGSYAKPQLSSAALSNGVFTLTVNGDNGPDYIVQASTNLTAWQSLFTNHLPTPPFTWSDSNAASFTRRFYRVQLGP